MGKKKGRGWEFEGGSISGRGGGKLGVEIGEGGKKFGKRNDGSS